MNAPDSAAASTRSAAPRPWYRRPLVVIAAIALLLFGAQWYDGHRQLDLLKQELAQRADQSRGAAELARDVQARIAALEAKQSEAQSQQSGLEARYQELSRSRDDALLADVEQSLLVADQQIRVAGSLRAALATLQAVDARLARVEPPAPLAALRQALAQDIERVKRAPQVDMAALAARLDELAAGVEALPLLADARPAAAPAARPPAADASAWTRLAREVWQDLRDLVRVQRLEGGDAAPLTPAQAWFLREHLRLRLLGARVALLGHHEKSYRADLKDARDWLTRYFDTRREPAAGALATLRQLDDGSAGVEPPAATAALEAVRSLRAARERR